MDAHTDCEARPISVYNPWRLIVEFDGWEDAEKALDLAYGIVLRTLSESQRLGIRFQDALPICIHTYMLPAFQQWEWYGAGDTTAKEALGRRLVADLRLDDHAAAWTWREVKGMQ